LKSTVFFEAGSFVDHYNILDWSYLTF